MNADRILIDRLVSRVWVRAWVLECLHALGWGFLVWAGIHAGWAALKMVLPGIPGLHGWLGVLPAAVVSGVVLARGRISLVQAAHAVDRRLCLKDRVVSAREFAHAARPHPIHGLQIADTAEHLAGAKPSTILPWRWRRDTGLLAAAAMLCALAQTVLPRGATAQASTPASTPFAVQQEAMGIERSIEELADAAEGEADEVVKEALEELRGLAESMREPGTAMEEAFEIMGRMRAELQRAADALDLARNQAMLEAWANALNASPHTRQAGRALEDRDYAEAAEAMEALAREAARDIEGFAGQSGALGAEAADLAEQAQEAGLSIFAETLRELSEGIRGQDAARSRGALESQAGQVRQQAMRESLARQLQQQMSQLSDAAGRMGGAYCPACLEGAGCEGQDGNCPSSGGNLARTIDGRDSREESTSIGLGEHDDPFGDATALEDAEFDPQGLQGQRNAGPSQAALEQGAPTQQAAGRDYVEVYSRYQKLSDAVLAQEALPSGYHPVIKRYFESIRPQRAEPDE